MSESLMTKRVVGTAGHIDHGKTALVRAITGIDCDRLPEEKRRGITIDLGFASWKADEFQVAFIDVPGHERFVRNMLAGVGGIDAALLVVAADESIKPQTREHFAICRLLQVPTGLIALTKADLVDDDILELVRLEVEEMVRGSFLEGHPIVPVSSTTARGIEEIKKALLDTLAESPERDRERKIFRLPIDRVFTMKGFGTVVTGTTLSGTLPLDAEIEVLPDGLTGRARNIQVHGEPREQAIAGERTSINLADIPLEDLRRGQQIVRPGRLRPSQIITAALELLPDARPLKDQTRIRFHHYSAERLGTIRIVDGSASPLPPGSTAFVQIRLESPVVAVSGDRFVIRRYSPQTTIGGGSILDAQIPKLGRGTRRSILETLSSGSLPDRLPLLARWGGLHGIGIHDLQVHTGLRSEVLRKELEKLRGPELVRVAGGRELRWIHADVLADLRRKAMEFLQGWFTENRVTVGIPKGELVQKILPKGLESGLVEFLLRDLEAQKIITIAGDLLDVPGRSRELSGVEGELGRLIEARFLEAGLTPPPVSQLIRSIPQRPKVIEGVIGYLVKTGRLVRLSEGIYLHPEVLERAAARLEEHRGKSVDVAWFKELYGISRKVIIPLLEWFDSVGLTKRSGDRREILQSSEHSDRHTPPGS